MQMSIDLVVELVKSMAVVIVVAYLFTLTRLYRQVLDRRLTVQGRVLLILIFGAFSIWGTLAGVEILGGIANTRDMGPALGGLLGGPIVGVGAGLIGAAQRLAMGGFTAVPSALATVMAGFAGGGVYLLFKRRVAPVWAAMLLALFTETFLMGLNLLMARPYADALALVREVIVPMIIVNAIGMGVFVLIIRNEERERVTRVQKERMESELNVAREIQLGIVPAIFPPFPEREEFDLYASLESAREVGGDLYDFFLLGRRPPLPGDRRRVGQRRTGLAVHGRDDHPPARRGPSHPPARRGAGPGQRAAVPRQRRGDVRHALLRGLRREDG